MSESREAQAFRAAFAREAEVLEPEEVTLPELKLELAEPGRRRRPWAAVAAAAAMVAVASGTVLLAEMAAGPRPESAVEPRLGESELPPSLEGWHWESRWNLAVQVPDSWAYGQAPNPDTDWCNNTHREPAPYIDPFAGQLPTAGVGCVGKPDLVPEMSAALEKYWQTHVEITRDQFSWDAAHGGLPPVPDDPGEIDGTWRHNGWTKVVKRIGVGRLTVFYDEAHAGIAAQILASARRLEHTNQDGCSITAPIQVPGDGHPRPLEPFDIEKMTSVETITVCQYERVPKDVPALLASRTLTGAVARDVLDEIKRAPVGSGPNSPGDCRYEWDYNQALVLWLDGQKELYVFNDGCLGNGFDDGTAVRRITEAACDPLYGGPVRIFQSSMALGDACWLDR